MAQSFDTTIGLAANATSAGQPVDFDGIAVSSCTITNNSGVSIQYTLDGSSWATITNGTSASPAISSPSTFRLRKSTSDSYPVVVAMAWTAQDASFNPSSVEITGGRIASSVAVAGLPGKRPTAVLGNIAQRMGTPQDFDSASKEAMFRVWIPIPGGYSGSVQIILPNAFIQGGSLFSGNGASTTFTASVEYVSGTRQQVLFGGSASGVAAPATLLNSDSLSLNVSAADGGFWFHTHLANASGIPRITTTGGNSDLGDGAVFSATTTPDLTMSGTVSFASAYTFRPVAIIGQTLSKSVLFLGDSIDKGQGPSADFLGNNSFIERVVGAEFPYINCSSPGAKAQDLAGLIAPFNFASLWQYNKIAVLGAGTNDIFLGSRTAAQVVTDTQTLSAKLVAAGLKVFTRTVLPQTTSTDSWATTANQTVKAQEAARVTLNTTLRSGTVTGISGVFDTAREVESAFNSGIWLPSFTADGIHPSEAATAAIANSGRINLPALRRA